MFKGFTIVGDPELNRVRRFAAAAVSAGVDVDVVPYSRLLTGDEGWASATNGRCVRLESPGRDFEVERGLLARGARCEVEPTCSSLASASLPQLRRDPGLIFATRQWYLGWRDLLDETARVVAHSGGSFFNAPDEISVMFDKVACHARLASAGICVPRALPIPLSFDDVMEKLRAAKWSRAFLKISHGSAANGVVGLAVSGDQMQAHTAIEVATVAGETRLYATRRLRVYRDRATIQRLIDALCREPVHLEAWVPKAGIAGRTADARVVVIGGRACHAVLRLARGAITNLHLGAERAGEDLLARVAGADAVVRLRATAEQAAACFPRAFCMGIDLALTPGFRKAYVLEVNAFGDLLEDTLWQGADTYTWQVRAWRARDWRAPADSREDTRRFHRGIPQVSLSGA